MSEKRIGIIAEGKCDFPIIERALKAIFPDCRFVFTHIQPSDTDLLGQTRNESGFGWVGVYYACNNLKSRLELQHAAGTDFDMIVIHIDGDVMKARYEEANITNHVADLPCYDINTSLQDNCVRLENVVISWLGGRIPDNTALCIPHINTDTWVSFILFPDKRDVFTESLCKEDLEEQLLNMSARVRIMRMKAGKIKKDYNKYVEAAECINKDIWEKLCRNFVQASRFTEYVQTVGMHSS